MLCYVVHCLGETIDLHGGGPDLIFPHHENERAQTEALTTKIFVNYWMHVGYVQQDKKKMSKSLGNFLTIRDFLTKYDPEVLRYFSIASHYRSPVDYTLEHIDVALKALERLYNAIRGLSLSGVNPLENTDYEKRFISSMDDDFNTPEAMAVLFELAREINRVSDSDIEQAKALGALLCKLGHVIGLLDRSPESFFQNVGGKTIDPTEIEKLIGQRNQARKLKNWAEADHIRDQLLEQGISLEDLPAGTIWHVIKKGQ